GSRFTSRSLIISARRVDSSVCRGRQFYTWLTTWLTQYREQGLEGLKNLKSGSRKLHLATRTPSSEDTIAPRGRIPRHLTAVACLGRLHQLEAHGDPAFGRAAER